MIVIRTETFSNLENEYFRRMKYLYSILKNRKNFLFVSNDPEKFIPGIKTEVCNNRDQKKIFETNPSLLIFDLKKPDRDDISLAEECNKKKIPIIQFCTSGINIIKNFPLINGDNNDFNNMKNDNILCSGLQYLILHHRFIHFNKKTKKYRNKTRRIFVSTGDILSYKEIRKLSEILINNGFLLTVGPTNSLKRFNRKTLKRIYNGIKFTGKRETLARAYYEADLSITSTGINSYESVATGTPALMINQTKEKNHIIKTLEEKGCSASIEKSSLLKKENLLKVINEKFTKESRVKMGETGKKLIDGKGIYRIINTLEENQLI